MTHRACDYKQVMEVDIFVSARSIRDVTEAKELSTGGRNSKRRDPRMLSSTLPSDLTGKEGKEGCFPILFFLSVSEREFIRPGLETSSWNPKILIYEKDQTVSNER